MKVMLQAAGVVLAVLFTGIAFSQDISAEEVRAFTTEMDRVVQAKDVDGMGRLMSESVQISATIRAGGRVQTETPGKAQYLQMTRDSFAMISNYVHRRNNERVEIKGDTAIVSAEIFESMVIGGQYVSAKSTEVTTLAKIGGRLVATRIVSDTTM